MELKIGGTDSTAMVGGGGGVEISYQPLPDRQKHHTIIEDGSGGCVPPHESIAPTL